MASPDSPDAPIPFATSVRPVEPGAIETPADGLVCGRVELAAADRAIPAYRAHPASGGRWPLVVVVSEIFGVHAYIADVARRFARLGYHAIAPEFFVRQGDVAAAAGLDAVRAIVSKAADAQVAGDLDAAVAHAQGEGADIDRMGVTGFCWGGRVTWLACARDARFRAGVAWYGKLVGPSSESQPTHPVDVAADLKAPVLGLYGGADTGIALDTVEAMKTALAAGSEAAKRSEFVVYPGAGHAFHADYRPSYDHAAAVDGWQRCTDWLRRHGV